MTMLTPKLWRALNHPPTRHPLFWRIVRSETPIPTFTPENHMNLLDKLSVVYLVLFGSTMLLTNVLDLAAQSTLLAFLLVLLALPIFFPVLLFLRVTVLGGSFYGLLWAMRISRLLAREHRNGTYDLLALLPSGRLAAMWAVSAACLYRNHTFTNALDLRLVILRLVALTGLLFMIGDLLGGSPEKWMTLTLLGTQTLVALLILYGDFVHSSVLAVLVGMIVPAFTRLDVRLWAAGGFLFFQVMTYTAAVFTATVIVPRFMPADVNGWTAHLITLALSLGVFFSVREAVIIGLWHWLVWLCNTTPAEADCAFTPS